MAGPKWDDLDQFIDPDDFGQKVLFDLNGPKKTVVGIFDESYLSADMGEYDMDSTKPRFTAKASDLEGVQRGHTVVIDGDLFDVMGYPQTDGVGFAVVPLSRVNA